MVLHKIPHEQFKINYKGRVHFQEWYKLVFNFLQSKGYRCVGNPNDPNFEDYLLEMKLSNGKVNNWIYWRCEKVRDEMFTYYVEVDFQVLLLEKIEVMHHGKKLKVNDGETNIFIRSYLHVDPSKTWSKNWLTRELYDLLERKHFKQQIEYERTTLYEDVLECHDRAKQALGCLTLKPRGAFHIDEKAFPDV